MFRVTSLCLATALSVVLAAPAVAQPAQTGTIAGVVQDTTGGVLPGAGVTLRSESRGVVRSVITDAHGRYVFASLAPGRYAVTAALDGFRNSTTDALVEVERTTSVTLQLQVGGLDELVTVEASATPLVDRTTVTATTRLRREEFDRLPVGRSYQALGTLAAGVVGGTVTGSNNVNALGALSASNLFIIDSVDTTDPVTGTFATSLNFEAIQEVSISTSAVSVEYGRGQGAIINVITKSGTNRFEGSARSVAVNDDWDAQNSTVSEVSGASLARVKFDQINPTSAFTLGGPIRRNRAWFFGAYEYTTNTTPERQTVGLIPENYQQSTDSQFLNLRGTVQITPAHQVWVRYHRPPTNGFIFDYWGNAAGERAALTEQNQTGHTRTAQWSGVFRGHTAVEASFGDYASRIEVVPFQVGRLGFAPYLSQSDNRYYNGATYDGVVERPRRQFNVSATRFFTLGSRGHAVKAGLDVQAVESSSLFRYPNDQLFVAESFNQATGSVVPLFRRDYVGGASTSTGRNYALYLRDKFELTSRLSVEAGVRLERQTGRSDLGVSTLDTTVGAPRVFASYALDEAGKSVITASYGRYYANVVQGFSDAFAGVPQQGDYDNFVWNGASYVFQNSVRVGGSTLPPNTDLDPSYLDEFTLGYQRQMGRNLAVGVRAISRVWGDLIDDVRTFNANGSVNRVVLNYDAAERSYRGLQVTLDKRYASHWSAAASYTLSRTEGNHFDPLFSPLGDYLDAQCRTTLDPTIGSGGVLPCAAVQNDARKTGRPIYDRPHNLKLLAGYVRPIGPVNLSLGALGEAVSKRRYEKVRSMNVLLPGTLSNAGPTATYFYNERGADPVPGLEWYIDGSVELTWRAPGATQFGLRGEAFNLTNREEKTLSNNTAFCGTTDNASCAAAVANYGKATARGAFQQPRRYRISAIFRF